MRDIVLFDNPLCEWLTRTPWYIVPIAWVPMVAYYLMESPCSWIMNGLLVFLGLFIWTLTEYVLHRFFFHAEDYWLPKNPKIFAYHFLIHGIHHAFPMDKFRLVFPVLPAYGLL